jgi:hypothetical protein
MVLDEATSISKIIKPYTIAHNGAICVYIKGLIHSMLTTSRDNVFSLNFEALASINQHMPHHPTYSAEKGHVPGNSK